MVRSPRFETAPSLCFPPVDFCMGVSPSQAAKSCPPAKPLEASAKAVMAVETIGPTPGIVISRPLCRQQTDDLHASNAPAEQHPSS
jgi:hypothetical protein